jgi:hypothetical protein
VLPAEIRPADVVGSIAREFTWVAENL